MEPYAVIETGSKQYRVKPKDILRVELLDSKPGSKITIDTVLALSDGKKLKIGNPLVKNAKVTSTVLEHVRGTKVISFKKKRRKGYSRKKGHRQELTVLKIENVL